jgi:predicted nucleic acid-binding protein
MKRRFVDTNILIYSAVEYPAHEEKQIRATEILTTEDCALSVQVLQEFYWQATHSKRLGHLSHARAVDYIAGFSECPVQPMTLDIFNAATASCQRYQISYWDAAIVEAARALGCRTVFSEDMQHGQDFGGVQVIDPFR